MTRKKPSKKATPQEMAKASIGIILFLGLTYLAITLFYILLIIGVILVITPLFMPTDDRFVLIGTGVAILVATFAGNALSNRLTTGKWKLSWPSLPGGF